jgi:hypothetical protein
VIRETAETTDCNVLPKEQFGYMSCSDARTFVREIFMDSDTDAAVLSFVPTAENAMPLSYREASATRQIVDALAGKRLLLHGRIIPNLPGDLERMSEVQETWKIAAWKTYTQYGPDRSTGWWLDDEQTGRPFLEKVRASGIHTVCCHKGLPLPFPLMGDKNVGYKSCRDVGPAAKANPDIAFIIYHSGHDPDLKESAFVPGKPAFGHGHPRPVPARCGHRAERKCVRRARLDVAQRHAGSRSGGAPHRQAPQVRRRGQRRVGHGLHLLRLAAGPDSGLPHLRDLRGVP